jgi:hypothetical protein
MGEMNKEAQRLTETQSNKSSDGSKDFDTAKDAIKVCKNRTVQA